MIFFLQARIDYTLVSHHLLWESSGWLVTCFIPGICVLDMKVILPTLNLVHSNHWRPSVVTNL